MPTQLTRQCQPADPAQSPPGPCKATFTANGRAGNQKLLGGGMVALQADETRAEAYSWEVTSSPPSCDYLLTGATQPQPEAVAAYARWYEVYRGLYPALKATFAAIADS